MGRLFKKEIQGPAYQCKGCDVRFHVYEDLPVKKLQFFEYLPILGKLYFFMEFDNVVIGNDTVPLLLDGVIDNTMQPVSCIGCTSLLGYYYGGADHRRRFNEGNYFINRLMLIGPPTGSDNENPLFEDE